MRNIRLRNILSRIFYSTTFTILSLTLIVLLLIPPGDAIRQAYDNDQIYNIFVIAGVYLLTLILAILIYASRLYTNRSVISSIPKTWIPIEKGDVARTVRRMIVGGLARSKIIAWEARPKDPRTDPSIQHINEPRASQDTAATKKSRKRQHRNLIQDGEASIEVLPKEPIWGPIAHLGWSSPSSSDLPNLQYQTVILELPHLIEARAVSLAPADPTVEPLENPTAEEVDEAPPPTPDPQAVEVLQRPATMGLRDYIDHLTLLHLINPPTLSADFLSQYDLARFSLTPLSEPQFRDLMRSFASILRGMTHLDPIILASFYPNPTSPSSSSSSSVYSTGEESQMSAAAASSSSLDEEGETSGYYESADDIDPHSYPQPSTSHPHSHPSASPTRRSSEGTIRTAPSRNPSRQNRLDSASPSASRYAVEPRKPSTGSLIVGRGGSRPRARSTMGYPISRSDSDTARSEGSIIRLANRAGGGGFPYTLHLDG
ncbi:MAG: hypothetical protein M1827_003136 [Pycnora praestabilis]|nr:MAG: hypothetical protein M1827_003136 [Pycnora praestabilis]